jgi:N-acetylmuramoyl-L-alanine amidase
VRRCVLACLGLLLAALALAQTELVVNGVTVPGARNDLVAGTAYAPAAALAEALGARIDVDHSARRLTLTLGGRVVQVRTVDDPGAAATLPDAVRRDGVAVAGGAGVLVGFEAYVPVKATAEALGARVTFLAASNQVLVVVPRPSLSARLEGSGSAERLVIRVSGPTRMTSFVNEAIQTVHLRFERSDLASPASFVGDAFVRADVAANRGDVDVRIQLAPDMRASWAELPDGQGFAVVVAFARSSGDAAMPVDASAPTRIVLDPAGGTGPAAGEAASDTLEVARIVAQRLERAGYEVTLTRSGPMVPAASDRAAQGTGARLFLTLQVADLPRGSLRLFHLGDAAELSALEDAVRINAEAVLERPDTDGVRRQILLNLVVDLDRGARYADALAGTLRDAGGFDVVGPRAAPVAVLTGAAGRGVLLEVGAADLRDPAFAPLLAAALASVVASGGALP